MLGGEGLLPLLLLVELLLLLLRGGLLCRASYHSCLSYPKIIIYAHGLQITQLEVDILNCSRQSLRRVENYSYVFKTRTVLRKFDRMKSAFYLYYSKRFLNASPFSKYHHPALSCCCWACLIDVCVFNLQVPRKLTSPVPGKMSYEDFVWFILSEEDKTSETALEYWFKWVQLKGCMSGML